MKAGAALVLSAAFLFLNSIDSSYLATLTTVRRNSEGVNWLLKHDISFTFDAGTKKSAA